MGATVSHASLSIVIPTADRHEYLPETLACLTKEIQRSGKDIRIIIADNASDPPIDMSMLGKLSSVEIVSIKRFQDRVAIGKSIERSSQLAVTDYVWVFGDDDLIVDGGLLIILETLNRHMPDYLYMNRFVAPHSMRKMIRTEHEVTTPFIDGNIIGKDAIARFNHHPGFITSLITKKGMLGADGEDLEGMFPGYGFLAALYSKTIKGKVSYISAPILVQRKSRTLWRALWPFYWLVSVPSLFKWLDSKGAESSYETVCKEVRSTAIRTAILAKASGVSVKDKLWFRSSCHQTPFNKLVFFMVRWFLPHYLAKGIMSIGLKWKGRRE